MSANVIKFPRETAPQEIRAGVSTPARRGNPGRDLPWHQSCLAGYAGAAALTFLLVLAGGTRHLAADVAAFAVLAAVIACRSRLPGAVGAAVIAWMFFDGFLAGRHAELRWHGTADGWRLGLLIVIAAGVSAARWLAGRRAA